ncbi:MAG: TlpA family protein disulfide reductase [Cyclobacteriaceae bacterium]
MRLLVVLFLLISTIAFSQIKLNPSYSYEINGKSISYNKGLKLLQSGKYVADISDENRTVNIKKPAGMEIGDPFPFESVTDIDGNTIDEQDVKGKVLVVNYWFTGCRPCVMEMPELNEVVAKYKSDEIVFLAYVNDIAPKVSSFLSKRKFDYMVIPGQMTATLNKGITVFPTHIFVDQDGIIVDRLVGYSEGVGDKIGNRIEKLLK